MDTKGIAMTMKNQVVDPAAQALLARADYEITEMMKQINDVAKDDNYKMQEELFRDVFLPLFAGEVPPDPRITMGFYINTIGNPYRKVDVLDQAGAKLFVVPAIVNRDTVQTGFSGGRTSFTEIMANHSLIGFNSQQQAGAYLMNEVARKKLLLFNTASGREEAAIWNDIFVRYGRKPPFDVPGVTDTSKSESTSISTLSENGFDSGFD
jgi:hypothetical protein